MAAKNGWFGPTVRADGGQQLVLRYAWPFGRRNSRAYREEYLPEVTVNGESVPVEWGTSILVLRDASYTVRAVQGGGSSEEIAGPLAVVHSGSAGTDEPAELVYAPSGPTGQLSRSNAAPPRLRAGQRDRKDVTSPLLAVYVWGFAYSLALGPPLAALLVRG